jgi:hypothetical protein
MAKAANWRPPAPSAGFLVWTAVFFALVFAGNIAFDYGIGDPRLSSTFATTRGG